MADKIAVIAGATRGIGFALVRALASAWDGTGTVYLTARRPEDGEAATARLAAEGCRVGWLQFDLADPASPGQLAATLRARHGTVDVAVLNGGYAPRAGLPAASDARPMIEANNHGTLRFLRAMAPIMGENARLIVVASGLGAVDLLWLATSPEGTPKFYGELVQHRRVLPFGD